MLSFSAHPITGMNYIRVIIRVQRFILPIRNGWQVIGNQPFNYVIRFSNPAEECVIYYRTMAPPIIIIWWMIWMKLPAGILNGREPWKCIIKMWIVRVIAKPMKKSWFIWNNPVLYFIVLLFVVTNNKIRVCHETYIVIIFAFFLLDCYCINGEVPMQKEIWNGQRLFGFVGWIVVVFEW